MATLEINGRDVEVDGSFFSLSPEQQDATVNEIAGQLGKTQQTNQASAVKGGRLAADEQATSAETQAGGSYLDAGVTWLDNAISGIPIVGPSIKQGSDYLGSSVLGLLSGEDPQQIREGVQGRRQVRDEQYPASATSGQIAGNLAAMSGLGSTVIGAKALGITGAKLLPRMGRSALSSGMISGADIAARGGSVGQTLSDAGIMGVVGGAIPLAGAGISKGLSAIGDKLRPVIGAALNPEAEAARRVGTAINRDLRANPSSVANAADEAAAREYGVPMLNADRGGETTRALARSVANQNPETRQIIEKAAQDRFAGQGNRAINAVRKLSGHNVDDVAFQDRIREVARLSNGPAYKKAYEQPQAGALWTKELSQLMQAPAMREAAKDATARGANRAAVEGFQPINNPFVFGENGVSLRSKADGSRALPSLRFWDQVKRNLDGKIGTAQRAGDKTLAGDLQAIKARLVSSLDDAVPEYKAARQGAAGFFDAEDALDAGKKFLNSSRSLPEAKKAYGRFSDPEKEAFRVGFASELVDRVKASPDRANVINQIFGNQASRESLELVFGPQKAKEIEAFVRVENIVDRLRGAMGNSTTARQLVEMGLGAGGGYFTTGDWTGAVTGAALARGSRYAGEKLDARVMERIGKLLTSDNPASIRGAIKAAAVAPAYMRALEAMGQVLALPTRSLALGANQ